MGFRWSSAFGLVFAAGMDSAGAKETTLRLPGCDLTSSQTERPSFLNTRRSRNNPCQLSAPPRSLYRRVKRDDGMVRPLQ